MGLEKQKTYILTEYGKKLKWSTFKALGGGGLPSGGVAGAVPERLWKEEITLEEVVGSDIASERGVARSCVEHLKMPELAEVEVYPVYT